MYNILLIALVTYGISTIITEYDGPFAVFYLLRRKVKTGLLSCAVCFAFWFSAFLALFLGYSVFEWLAALGLVVFMERFEI